MWNTVLFDLDGTITDSGEGIMKSVQYTLEKLGKPEPVLENLRCFVGPPLKEQFMEYAHLDEEEGELAVRYYRERYKKTGIYENSLYPGMVQMLEELRKNGIQMCVASSKPEVFVKQILKYFKIDGYFRVIVGSEMNGERTDKADVIREAIRRLGMEKRKYEIVMVGDRKYDVIGAKEAGIACVGVTYGYGPLEEMEGTGAVYLAPDTASLGAYLVKQFTAEKRESVLQKIWRCLYPVGIHYGIMLLISSVWSLVYISLQMYLHGNMDAEEIMRAILKQNNLITIVVSLVMLPLVYWLYRKDEEKRRRPGTDKRAMTPGKFGVGAMLCVAVFAIFASSVLNELIAALKLNELFDTYAQMAEYMFDSDMAVVNLISIGILAPMAEELVFRGLVFRRMRDYLSLPAAIVLSSLIFGVYHGNVVQAIYAGLLGILLALLYERYQTLWAPVLAHMSANLFATIGNMVPFSAETANSGATFLFFFIEVVTTGIFGVIIFKTKPKKG